ncbi:hypothetical protein GJA_2132 [Janthinobacterium agaricidamnosum NBRC 102515 = DSM 9628]|uniref:Uncharacterized protein n=1 Tax=Janthinobacterium agaricidamnosum NBRC 102515 = DSM 9628 TaxID=1349767 RepID=W0V672_9BURK|nr:hypothetical protein GJA_2132 [Janthinobacterium agaricidamnosum NBRC 102515 = DSM 9628]
MVSSTFSGNKLQADMPSRTTEATTNDNFFCMTFCKKVLTKFLQ